MKIKNIEKVAVLTLGCSKNVVDSENLMGMMRSAGIEIVENLKQADAIIVNTCGFVESAKTESIEAIFEMTEYRRRKSAQKLIVMGCLSERYAESLKNQIPLIDDIYGVNSYDEVLNALGKKPVQDYGRVLLTPSHYSYLKIAEGCNHKCAFCAIPSIRGAYRSRTIEELLAEAEKLAASGVKELNIIAQDSTYYGKDLYGEQMLPKLLQELADLNLFPWIRLLYTYPTNFPLSLAKVIADNESICSYLDLPLQHISDKVLKAMGRGSNQKKIKSLLEELRKSIPNLRLRTTFIVGFPNETEEDFEELAQFIEEQEFDRLGVFAYSREDGTPAFELGDPISIETKNKRIERLMLLQQEISLRKNRMLVGKDIEVIIDSDNTKSYIGRTRFDAPEIDNGVIIRSKKKLKAGEIIKTKVIEASEYDIIVQY